MALARLLVITIITQARDQEYFQLYDTHVNSWELLGNNLRII